MAVTVKQKVRFGPFVLDIRSAELCKNGQRLRVQPQPIQVLTILLEHPAELVTREEIRSRIWPSDTFVDFEHGLNTAVKKLRQALGDESETPAYIETLPRRGYRFIATLEEDSTPKSEPVNGHSEHVGGGVPEEPPKPVNQSFSRRWLIVGVAFGTLAAVGGIGYRVLFPTSPRIIRSRSLTHTIAQKGGALVTDGNRVYFNEHRTSDRWGLFQVSTNGGDTAEITFRPGSRRPELFGISPTFSELIIEESGRNWSLPIPAGPPRLLDDLVPGDAYWILWMPDGKSLLYTVGNDMFRVNRDGTARKRLLSSQFGFYSSPHVSPDGKRVCWVVKGSPPNESTDLWEATVELGEPHLVFPEFKGEIEYGDWTANGKLFFFIRRVHNEASLWVTRDEQRFYSRQRPPVLLYAGPKELIGPVSSRDSKEIYAIGSEPRGELSVYDPNHKQFIPYLGGISACYISFSPDRQWIAYVSFPEGTLWKSRLDGSEKMQLTDKPTGVVNPRWSPDGKLIVFMDVLASEHPGIFYVPAEGGRARLLVSGESAPGDPTWSPDSKSIIYSEGNWYTPKRKVMLLDLGSMKSEAIPGSDGLWSSRWSPDGKYIVAHTFGPDADQKMMLYSFATRKWRPLPSGRRQGWEAWSHDTKYVYSYDQETGSISRVNIETEKVETVADLHGVLWTAYLMRSFGWFDLTPDDQVMILRNTGSDEIYAFELEY